MCDGMRVGVFAVGCALSLSCFAAEIAVQGGKGLKVVHGELDRLEPNGLYGMGVDVRRDGFGGSVIYGNDGCFVVERRTWSGWRNFKAVIRASELGGKVARRFATYDAPSGATFRVTQPMAPLRAVHAKVCGLTLGHGEAMDGNDYSFAAAFGSFARMDARPLVGHSTGCFNTDRINLSGDSRIAYCHELEGRTFLSGSVTAGASWRKEGSFAIECSIDGENWTWLGSVDGVTCRDFALPANLFPTRRLHVRIVGRPGCNIQLNRYVLRARVDGKPMSASGSTRYVEASGGTTFGEVGPNPLFDESYGAIVGGGGGIDLWRAESGWKVARHRKAPERRETGIVLNTAANEAESVQLVVTPRKGLADVRVDANVPGMWTEVRRVEYVTVTIPTDSAGSCGRHPDPLPPQDPRPFAVEAGVNQPFWITVRPPKGMPKGLYRGEISVSCRDADGTDKSMPVPLTVEVFGFSFPDEVSLKSRFGVHPPQYTDWFHAKTHDERRRTLDRLYELYGDCHISPGSVVQYDTWEPTWDKSAGESCPEKWEPVFRWKQWDAAVERVFEKYHFNTINILPYYFRSGIGNDVRISDIAGLKQDHPAHAVLTEKYLRGLSRHLAEKGWDRKAYVQWFDEPTERAYPALREGTAILRRAMPNVKVLVTEQPEEDNLGGADIWCPLTHMLHSAQEMPRRAAGDEFWWYVCNEPLAPYFGTFSDRPASECRLWAWESRKFNIEGMLLWSMFSWTSDAAYPDGIQDPYADPMTWFGLGSLAAKGVRNPCGNGCGRLVYPPRRCVETRGDRSAALVKDAPVPSQRLFQLRDGIEDYEYFRMLERLDPKNPLLAVPADVCVSETEYGHDPAAMDAHRLKLAREIERLSSSTSPWGDAKAPNYDESKVGPYTLEDPLTFADGTKLTSPDQWPKRRAEKHGIAACDWIWAMDFADRIFARDKNIESQ